MNQEVKKKWVEALRNGEYTQARGVLNNPNNGTYCCLGVLCDLHAKETGNKWCSYGTMAEYLDEDCGLPPTVITWAGLPANTIDPGGVVVNSGRYSTLMALNDGGTPFSKIADVIEGQL